MSEATMTKLPPFHQSVMAALTRAFDAREDPKVVGYLDLIRDTEVPTKDLPGVITACEKFRDRIQGWELPGLIAQADFTIKNLQLRQQDAEAAAAIAGSEKR